MPIKVAFLLRDLGQGGAERSALRLINGLSREGFAVSLLLLKKKGELLKAVDPSVTLIDLRGSFLNLIKCLRALNPQFLFPVYTSMRALLSKIIIDWGSKTQGMKVVLSQRNMFTMDRGPIQTKLRFLRSRLLFPWASACVCISHGVAEEMERLRLLPPEKIHVIYNPVFTEELQKQRDDNLTHPWLDQSKESIVLGVGRLGDQKDFSTLIEAFYLAKKERRELKLLILGEGKERSLLERKVKELGLEEAVQMPGYVPNPYPYMKRAALFVLTSRFEGFGNVVAEALACGCNVVSTACPSGPSEILDDGKYGWLAKVGDAESVAEAILKALKTPLPSSTLIERARFFSEERAVEGYSLLMKKLSRAE